MASTTAKVKTLISVLQGASVLDTGRWVETITSACIELNVFSSLSKHIPKSTSQKKKYNGFDEAIEDDYKNLSLLILASIGRSLFQFNEQGDPYGFRSGTNRGLCEGMIQDSLVALLPIMLRVHIDEAIQKHNEDLLQKKYDPLGDKPVVLGYLNSFVDDDEFMKEFSERILSETFIQNEQFFQSQDKTGSSTNSWMNVLFVYTYLQHKGQPPAQGPILGRFDGNAFMNVAKARDGLPALQAWLDNNHAASEGATYSTVLRNMASSEEQDQNALDVIKNKEAILKEIKKAPLTGLYLPQHDKDVTTLSTGTYLLVRLPTWALNVEQPLALDLTLGEASQNFMRGFTLEWNSFVEHRLKDTLASALVSYKTEYAAFSVRGRNIKWPVPFAIREYGRDIIDEISRLSQETGTHYFNPQLNDRLRYVEGDSDISAKNWFEKVFVDSGKPQPLLPDNAKVMQVKGDGLVFRPHGTDY